MTTQIRPYIALLVVVISCLISSAAAAVNGYFNRATNSRHILCAFSSPSLYHHNTASISKQCHWYSTSIPFVNKALLSQQQYQCRTIHQSNVKLYQSTQSTSSVSNSNISDEYPLIILIGGSGFLGTEIRNQLKQRNLQYIATSTSGKSGSSTKISKENDKFVKLDLTSVNAKEQVYRLIMSQLRTTDTQEGSSSSSSKKVAIISAMGSIGTNQDELVNSALSNAIKGAHRVNLSSSTSSSSISSSPESTTDRKDSDDNKVVERFIMIGNTDRVRRLASNVPFLKGYASGKEVRYQSRHIFHIIVGINFCAYLHSYL